MNGLGFEVKASLLQLRHDFVETKYSNLLCEKARPMILELTSDEERQEIITYE